MFPLTSHLSPLTFIKSVFTSFTSGLLPPNKKNNKVFVSLTAGLWPPNKKSPNPCICQFFVVPLQPIWIRCGTTRRICRRRCGYLCSPPFRASLPRSLCALFPPPHPSAPRPPDCIKSIVSLLIRCVVSLHVYLYNMGFPIRCSASAHGLYIQLPTWPLFTHPITSHL